MARDFYADVDLSDEIKLLVDEHVKRYSFNRNARNDLYALTAEMMSEKDAKTQRGYRWYYAYDRFVCVTEPQYLDVVLKQLHDTHLCSISCVLDLTVTQLNLLERFRYRAEDIDRSTPRFEDGVPNLSDANLNFLVDASSFCQQLWNALFNRLGFAA